VPIENKEFLSSWTSDGISVASVGPLVQKLKVKAEDQPVAAAPQIVDARRQARFKIKVDVRIDSRTCSVLKCYSVDISESGISAMLMHELPVGEIVEMEFTLPFGPVRTYAIVRQRNAFRYGFQFIKSHEADGVIHRTCSQLALEQTLLEDL